MPVAGSGSRQLALLAARLKIAGEGELRRELLRGLKLAAEPAVKAVHDAALAQLPHGGGLNKQVADQKVKVQVRLGAETAGVRLTTDAPDTQQTDKGFVRRPVYGNKKVWRTQRIPKATGWWSDTLAREGYEVQPKLLMAMKTVELEIQGGI